ncbi:MAG: DUF4215 domain-containing protein [Myxococcales bacterium]|nr:DUF4215 domain-containing protein [Myxococcales bacterium]
MVGLWAAAACGGDGPVEGGDTSGGGTMIGTSTGGPDATTTSAQTTSDVPTGGSMTAIETTGTAPTTDTSTGDDTTSAGATSTGDEGTSTGEASTGEASTGDTSSGGPDPFCGDGVVNGEGEQCDDGNADDSDTCVAGCKDASCGDGFVGPGEGCDDANQVDDDACSNACAPASCGDGALQQGEACDDGDDDNGDGCLDTCALASCGDGFVQAGVEACDDGDADDTDVCVQGCKDASCGDGFVQAGVEDCDDGDDDDSDECTVLCQAPSCSDGIVSGDESDVDCGGGCDDCEVGDACGGGGDCETGTCDQGSCALAPSCKALKAAQPDAADGVYQVDPDGGGPGAAFPVYCDMTTDGGGWGLVMRFAPANGQFHFYSTHWTQVSLVNEGVTSPTDPSDGKFPAYNAMPGAEIRGCLRHPQTQQYGCKVYALPGSTTPLALFSTTPVGSDIAGKALYFNETQAEKLQWLTIQGRSVNEASVSPNYVAVGVNIDDDQSCYDARVRFGLVLNNEANITTLNDAAGFGAQAYYTVGCDVPAGVDSPWRTACGFQAGPTSYHTAGNIWFR